MISFLLCLALLIIGYFVYGKIVDNTFTVDRSKSGLKDFSDDFAAVTTAPVHGKMTQLRVFIDRCSIEAFDAEGRMAMTNLVFPTKPYNKVMVKGKAKYAVYNLK